MRNRPQEAIDHRAKGASTANIAKPMSDTRSITIRRSLIYIGIISVGMVLGWLLPTGFLSNSWRTLFISRPRHYRRPHLERDDFRRKRILRLSDSFGILRDGFDP